MGRPARLPGVCAGRGAGAALRPGYRAAGEVGWINEGSAPSGVVLMAGIIGRGDAVMVADVITSLASESGKPKTE